MKVHTIGELLHWSYANLAMNHAAVTAGKAKVGRLHFMIRSRLYKGLQTGTMNLGSIADDERLKMVLPQACCYCGATHKLSIDHLIPSNNGGADSGDNLVWAIALPRFVCYPTGVVASKRMLPAIPPRDPTDVHFEPRAPQG